MTTPMWPARLPLPERDSYSYALPDLLQRSQFAIGGRARRLFSDGSDTFSASVDLTADEWDYLQNWFRHGIADGASWFEMPLLARGRITTLEVQFTEPLSFQLVGPTDVRVPLRLQSRIGTTMSAEEWSDLNDGVGFEDAIQTLLVPSDTAILNPAAGDAAPGDPIPWGGLWLPYGGRISLEGDDGVSTVIELPPNTRFTGLIPRRLLVIGTDADAVVYGLSHPDITALPANSGNRIVPVVPSNTVNLPSPAVGGIYSLPGGLLSYQTAAGASSRVLPPKRWLSDAVLTRVNATGTDPEFAAVAFVQS